MAAAPPGRCKNTRPRLDNPGFVVFRFLISTQLKRGDYWAWKELAAERSSNKERKLYMSFILTLRRAITITFKYKPEVDLAHSPQGDLNI